LVNRYRSAGRATRANDPRQRTTPSPARSTHARARARTPTVQRRRLEARDQPGQHRRQAAGQALERVGVGGRANPEHLQEVSCGRDFRAFSSSLDKSLTLQACAATIGALGDEKDRIGGGAEQVVGDASMAARDLLCELCR